MKRNFRLVSLSRTFPGVCRARVYEALADRPEKIADHVFDAWPSVEDSAALLRDPAAFIVATETA